MDREFIEKQLLATRRFLKEKYGIKKLGIFGSYSRNQQTKISDLDILVEFEEEVGLEFLEVKFFLEDWLGIKVDLATEAMLKPAIREKVLNEVIFIDEYTDRVSKNFKQKVEELVNRLEPKEKENGSLYQLTKGICVDYFNETANKNVENSHLIKGSIFCYSKPGGQGFFTEKACECGENKKCQAFEDSQRFYERFQELSSKGYKKRKEIINAIGPEFHGSQWWSDNVK